MKLIAELLAGEAIIAAMWWLTNAEHDPGFLIALLTAGAIVIWSAGRYEGRCRAVKLPRRTTRTSARAERKPR